MRLTNQDASFLYTETASGPMHGAGISIVDGEIEFATLFKHIESRLHLVPRYRQRIVFVPLNLAHPKWVDDPNFDLGNHVKLHQLPANSTIDDALGEAMVLGEKMLSRDRPMWVTYVLKGVPNRTVLVQIGHHAMVDGASGVDISLLLFDLQKNPEPIAEPTQAWSPKPLPSAAELTAEAIAELGQNITSNPFRSQSFRNDRNEMLRRAGESMTRFISEPVITAPWNNASVGPKRQFEFRQFSFGEFRDIRRAFGGTINDVVLTVVAEAAARYLQSHNESVQGRHLRLMCPVSVRRENEHGALGNRVSGIFPMFDAEPMNIVERMQKTRWETEQIKQNREAQALELMMESMPNLPPVAMAATQLVGTSMDPTVFAANFPAPIPPPFVPRMPMVGFNFTCTNVPGVQTAQYIAGHEVLDNLAQLMLSGTLGYGVAVTSYNQKLYFNFVCDPRMMPDLDLMSEGVEASFHELLEAARIEEAQEAS